MSTATQSTNAAGLYGTVTDRAQEIYDQLLTVGKEVAAAYVDAYQKTAAGIAEYQAKVSNGGWSGGPSAEPDGQLWGTTATNAGASLREARARALEISEKLQQMNRKIMLAYLNASELAGLAVADCQEELSAISNLELVKTMGGARVAFKREMTQACASAARQVLG